MVIVLDAQATEDHIQGVIAALVERGFDAHRSTGVERTVIGAVGGRREGVDPNDFRVLPGVRDVLRISEPYKLAGRTFRSEATVIDLGGGIQVGGDDVVIMAGPCAVEGEAQIDETARRVAAAGARVLRGGAFKPRTSPYSFQGLGAEGLKLLRAAADRQRLKTVSEIMDPSQADLMEPYVDIFQVGARNMQNYHLLRELGRRRKPVLLQRGMAATLEELLMSAEYILSGGNSQVMLCERGIRTFEGATRNTFDISAVPVLKGLTHLPIVADPSHGIGLRDKVTPMARAAVAAGCDAVLVEVHPDPDHALSDGAQSLRIEQFERLMTEIKAIALAIGRRLA